MLDSYYLNFVDTAKIELDAKTAWKIYELLNTASMYLPDAAAYYLNQWQGGDDVDYVMMLHAYEDAKICECYAGAIRGMLCNAISPRLMDCLERDKSREYQQEYQRTQELINSIRQTLQSTSEFDEKGERDVASRN